MSESNKKVLTGEVVSSKSNFDKKDIHNVDVESYKTVAALGYIFFLIPIILAPKSAFARFHANQGLLLQIYTLIIMVFAGIPFLGLIIAFFGFLLSILLFIFGLFQANNGIKGRLPIIGNYDIIK